MNTGPTWTEQAYFDQFSATPAQSKFGSWLVLLPEFSAPIRHRDVDAHYPVGMYVAAHAPSGTIAVLDFGTDADPVDRRTLSEIKVFHVPTRSPSGRTELAYTITLDFSWGVRSACDSCAVPEGSIAFVSAGDTVLIAWTSFVSPFITLFEAATGQYVGSIPTWRFVSRSGPVAAHGDLLAVHCLPKTPRGSFDYCNVHETIHRGGVLEDADLAVVAGMPDARLYSHAFSDEPGVFVFQLHPPGCPFAGVPLSQEPHGALVEPLHASKSALKNATFTHVRTLGHKEGRTVDRKFFMRPLAFSEDGHHLIREDVESMGFLALHSGVQSWRRCVSNPGPPRVEEVDVDYEDRDVGIKTVAYVQPHGDSWVVKGYDVVLHGKTNASPQPEMLLSNTWDTSVSIANLAGIGLVKAGPTSLSVWTTPDMAAMSRLSPLWVAWIGSVHRGGLYRRGMMARAAAAAAAAAAAGPRKSGRSKRARARV